MKIYTMRKGKLVEDKMATLINSHPILTLLFGCGLYVLGCFIESII